LDLSFSPALNLIVGPNGAGKSNLLEAVAVLAAGESHRDAEIKRCFPWDKDAFALEGDFRGEEDLLIEARQQRGRPRQVKVNNAPQRRLRDWLGRVPVVSFSPEDLDLVKGEPSGRRKALNTLLFQCLPGYADLWQRYAGIVEERNAALKAAQEGHAGPSSLDPWDLALLREGAAVTLARRDFLAAFEPLVSGRHAVLCGAERAALVYKPSLLLPAVSPQSLPPEAAEVVAANRRRLQDLREGEIATGSSLIGPHRDDVELLLDGRPARGFASQGQQRSLAIAFKLAERMVLKDRLGREPICLLDDMLSELDPVRRSGLAPLLADGAQCLVTMTSLKDWESLSSGMGGAAVVEIGGPRTAESPAL
jgi:DNA replication and repair protein RecF